MLQKCDSGAYVQQCSVSESVEAFCGRQQRQLFTHDDRARRVSALREVVGSDIERQCKVQEYLNVF